MKKYLFLITFIAAFAWNTGEVVAQEPAPNTEPQTVEVQPEDGVIHPAFTDIPDTVQIELDGKTIRFIATDVKDLAAYIVKEYTEVKSLEDPPTSAWGWILYLVGTIGIGTLVSRFTQAVKVFGQLKEFFAKRNSPANIVGALSVGVGVAAGFIWPGGFDWDVVIKATLGAFSAAILVYENFIKKRNAEA